MSAERFATKAGANDSADLQYDSLSETEFHENELKQFSREFPCRQGNYFTTGGGLAHPLGFDILPFLTEGDSRTSRYGFLFGFDWSACSVRNVHRLSCRPCRR